MCNLTTVYSRQKRFINEINIGKVYKAMFAPSTINKQVSFGGVISSVRVIGYVIGGEYTNRNRSFRLNSSKQKTSLKIIFRPMISQ